MGLLDFLKRLGFGEGAGHDVGELARRLGLPEDSLLAFQPAYRTFERPKRSGGVRVIAAPSDELKAVQRRILHKLLRRLKTHPAAHGFERGRSIVTNALPHQAKAVVVRMDLERFFDSIPAKAAQHFFRKIGWNRRASALLVSLTTWRGSLPQGAPTSPRLSNLLNRRLDSRLSGLARKLGASYTRYADDLTFSFETDVPTAVHNLIHGAKEIVDHEGYRLHQQRKLHIRRRHDRQVVTGLVVNYAVDLPRARRRWLRAVEHRLATGRSASLTRAQLRGWDSFRSMIDRQAGG